LGRLFLGSTTEAVLRGSTMPVLALGPAARTAAADRRCFERILVAVDGSAPSNAAVEAALELAADARLPLLFCSVAENEAPESVRAIVDRAGARARERGVSAEGRVLEGSPAAALVREAHDPRIDLIVAGSHGRRGVSRFLLGSVAEELVRTSSVPVLVVRTVAVASERPRGTFSHS
jgi:nucleotide-binding universal stress UspA family protein